MAEYVMTTVTIGGPLSGEGAVEALIEAAGAYFSGAGSQVREALTEETAVTFEDDQNYGKTPSLDAFCREHGLSYQRAWISQLGVFEAGLQHWRPEMGEPVEEAADEGGEPMMTLAALRRCEEAGQTLADVVARLDRAVSTAVPPLRVVSANGGAD